MEGENIIPHHYSVEGKRILIFFGGKKCISSRALLAVMLNKFLFII